MAKPKSIQDQVKEWAPTILCPLIFAAFVWKGADMINYDPNDAQAKKFKSSLKNNLKIVDKKFRIRFSFQNLTYLLKNQKTVIYDLTTLPN